MTYGIVILALGYDVYGSCAYNLALSLKSNDNHIRVCILHDGQATKHLSKKELEIFDSNILIPESDWIIGGVKHYFRAKLLLNKYTPFDYTLYMDADNIWFPEKKVSWFLGEVVHEDFLIGCNGEYNVNGGTSTASNKYPFWGDAKEICKYWGITNFLPQTVSGFMAFRKCELSDKIFTGALLAYDDPKAPGKDWVNGKSDEYCFNVSLALLNIKQKPFKVFYFDRLDGNKPPEEIYRDWWGLATGGNKVSQNVVILYNRLVNRYSQLRGMTSRYYHKDKADFVPERKKL